jgi:hypothetical protein
MKAAEVCSIPCAICGALPGYQCTQAGRVRQGPHPWRRERAKALFGWMGPVELSPLERNRRRKLVHKMPRKRER